MPLRNRVLLLSRGGLAEAAEDAWMVEVNGFVTDVRHAPREVQEIALEKGLIPYIPGRVEDQRE